MGFSARIVPVEETLGVFQNEFLNEITTTNTI